MSMLLYEHKQKDSSFHNYDYPVLRPQSIGTRKLDTYRRITRVSIHASDSCDEYT